MEAKKIVLVEDNTIIRNGLISLVQSTQDLVLERSYLRGEDLLIDAPFISPDLVLIDVHLGAGLTGIETIKLAKPLFPKASFLVLTVFEDADSVFDSLRSGAVGYLLKSTSPEKILESMRDALAGGSPMSSQIARKVVEVFSVTKPQTDELEQLTPRETEILNLLSKGFRYKEIAEQLFISRETVRTHIRNIYEKLEVRSNTEAVIKYLKNK